MIKITYLNDDVQYKRISYLGNTLFVPNWITTIATDRDGKIYGYRNTFIEPVEINNFHQWDYSDEGMIELDGKMFRQETLFIGKCELDIPWKDTKVNYYEHEN